MLAGHEVGELLCDSCSSSDWSDDKKLDRWFIMSWDFCSRVIPEDSSVEWGVARRMVLVCSVIAECTPFCGAGGGNSFIMSMSLLLFILARPVGSFEFVVVGGVII